MRYEFSFTPMGANGAPIFSIPAAVIVSRHPEDAGEFLVDAFEIGRHTVDPTSLLGDSMWASLEAAGHLDEIKSRLSTTVGRPLPDSVTM